MKLIYLLLIACCLIISCSSLPQLYPVGDSAAPELLQKCCSPFPNGKWQFLHSIEATMPGGKKGFIMGLTIVSAKDNSVRCVIMTIEGLVLFDAEYDSRLVINRGIAPFESKDFARGLMKDIRLMFFKPPGSVIESGSLKIGSSVCRYRNPDDRTVDIIINADNTWEIRLYGSDLHPDRTVKAYPAKKTCPTGQEGIPGRIELTAYGPLGYTLVMNLVEAVSLTQ